MYEEPQKYLSQYQCCRAYSLLGLLHSLLWSLWHPDPNFDSFRAEECFLISSLVDETQNVPLCPLDY